MSPLYLQISTLCAQHGITCSKLCADIGISRGILTDLKAGRKKDVYTSTAYKIAKYFDVTIEYLLEFDSKQKGEPDASDSPKYAP